MAQQPATLSGSDRIRALTDEDAIFHAFDSYPWTKDKTFMSGLHAILGDPSNPQGSLDDMAIHARSFYYIQAIGVSIDFTRYKSWLTRNPHRQPPNILPPEYRNPPQSSEAPALSWQQAAPKADLYIDKSAAAAEAAAAASSGPNDQPSYPMRFAEMLQLLQEGKEVPGIRQIPNTIIRDPSVKPVGTRQVPRKPWERAEAAPTVAPKARQELDSDFPPVDEVPGSSAEPVTST